MTVAEVADLLRTTPKGIYGLIERGSIPGLIRLNRRLLFDRQIVVEWIDEKRVVSLTTKGNQR